MLDVLRPQRAAQMQARLRMRRVLIVTSSYAPTMIADMHRARQLAWELPKLGWDVEILSPDAGYQKQSHIDGDSAAFFTPDTAVHFVPEFLSGLFRAIGAGTIGWRAIVPMYRSGARLLRRRRFDLIYFSTAQFPLFLLGPAWRRRFGVPFVLDFHDPCYREAPAHGRPGEGVKQAISRGLSKYTESGPTVAASGLVSVSPAYIEHLRRRYQARNPAWLRASRQACIPFGALPDDLVEAAKGIGDENRSGPARIVYVGAGAPIMHRSFSLICQALAELRSENRPLAEAVRIELYGTMTGWRDGDARPLADLARDRGIGDLVKEEPRWVSYRRSLELLVESDGALILGVDDAGYMPSKLFNYALSGKPLLASLHRRGPAFAEFQASPSLGHVLWFDERDEMPARDAAMILASFLKEVTARRRFDRRAALEPFLASAMARRHAELFEACL